MCMYVLYASVQYICVLEFEKYFTKCSLRGSAMLICCFFFLFYFLCSSVLCFSNLKNRSLIFTCTTNCTCENHQSLVLQANVLVIGKKEFKRIQFFT